MVKSKSSRNKGIVLETLAIFQDLNFFMLRVPLLSTQFYQKCFEQESTNKSEITEKTIEKLTTLAHEPVIREAIATTSISLLHSLDKLANEKDLRKRKQTVISFIKYLIRMSTRPTPFGILAGVTAGTFDESTQLEVDKLGCYRKRTRPDMEWLMGFITKLEQRPEIVEQLKVRANSTVLLSGNRLELPYTTQYDQEGLSQDHKEIEGVSIRATEVVLYTLERGKQLIGFQELVGEIQQKYPETSLDKIRKFLWQLFQNEILISELRPPLMIKQSVSPLDYVIKKLENIDGIAYEKERLTEIRTSIDQYDQQQLGQGVQMFLSIVSKMNSLVETKNPLQVDLAVSTKDCRLNKKISQDIAEAAECLWRLSPGDTSSPGLKDYRKEFIEKYGTDREVPVLELLDEDRGLGAPYSYRFPLSRRDAKQQNSPMTANMEKFLLREILKVIKNKQSEIEITLKMLEQLEIIPPDSRQVPISLEIYGTIAADSEDALDNGDYEIVLGRNSGSTGAGKTFGRFLDILPAKCRQEIYCINEREKAHLSEDTVTAEIVYMPYGGRAANVVISENSRDYEITIGTNSSKDDPHSLSIADFLIGATTEYFYIKSKTLGKRVSVKTGHMFNILNAPNVFRFLLEVSQDGIRDWSPLLIGAMSEMPYVPRIRFKKTILSPAMWKLTWQLLNVGKENVTSGNFAPYIERWRSEWQVPPFVFLTEGDNRILLDLRHPWHLEILLEELIRKQQEVGLTLIEMPAKLTENWLNGNGGGYMEEIVVPLIKGDQFIRHHTLVNENEKQQIIAIPERVSHLSKMHPKLPNYVRNKYPGGEWLYVKLYGNSNRAEEFIAFGLRDFCNHMMSEEKLVTQWFFIRYADPEPHFRVRFNGNPEVIISKVVPALHSWCLELERDGLLSRVVIDTYEREVERYGGPQLIEDIETIFYHDSVIASELLFLKRTGQLALEFEAVAAVSIIHFLTSLHWGIDKQIAWFDKRIAPKEFLKEFGKHRKLYMKVGDEENNWQNLRNEKQGETIYNILMARGKMVRALAAKMQQMEQRQTLWNSQDAIIGGLIHMHCNRLFGLDREKEKQIMALTRHTLYNLRQFRLVVKGQREEGVVDFVKEAR